jgi:uncharacterized protein YukE
MNVEQHTQGKPDGMLAGEKLRDFARSAEAEMETVAATAAKEGGAAMKQIEAGSQEWMGWARDAFQANVKAWHALLGCRTAQAALTVQTNLMVEQVKLLMGHGQHMTAAVLQAAPAKRSRPKAT